MAYMNQERKAALAPAIMAICKEYGIKATLSVRHHSGLCLNIKSGEIDFLGQYNEDMRKSRERDIADGKTWLEPWKDEHYIQVNEYHLEWWEGKARSFFESVREAMMRGNHNNSDPMTDYFDVGWYIYINVGSFEKPYIYTPRKVEEPRLKIKWLARVMTMLICCKKLVTDGHFCIDRRFISTIENSKGKSNAFKAGEYVTFGGDYADRFTQYEWEKMVNQFSEVTDNLPQHGCEMIDGYSVDSEGNKERIFQAKSGEIETYFDPRYVEMFNDFEWCLTGDGKSPAILKWQGEIVGYVMPMYLPHGAFKLWVDDCKQIISDTTMEADRTENNEREETSTELAIIEHTTKRGKVLRGIIRHDIDKDTATAIDPYTFRKDGGWFIREKHVSVGTTQETGKKLSRDQACKKHEKAMHCKGFNEITKEYPTKESVLEFWHDIKDLTWTGTFGESPWNSILTDTAFYLHEDKNPGENHIYFEQVMNLLRFYRGKYNGTEKTIPELELPAPAVAEVDMVSQPEQEEQAEPELIRFEPGKTYYTSSVCDHNCIYSITVNRRTEKTIYCTDESGESKIYRVKIGDTYDGTGRKVERVSSGNWSMAHGWNANDTKELKRDWERPETIEKRQEAERMDLSMVAMENLISGVPIDEVMGQWKNDGGTLPDPHGAVCKSPAKATTTCPPQARWGSVTPTGAVMCKPVKTISPGLDPDRYIVLIVADPVP